MSHIIVKSPANLLGVLPVRIANNQRYSDDVLRHGRLEALDGETLVTVGNRDFAGPQWACDLIVEHWAEVNRLWEAGEDVNLLIELP